MTPAGFCQELADARPGEQINYATGTTLKGNPVARTALAAYFRGEVDLMQKRIAGPDGLTGTFAYIAVKRRDVRRPEIPLNIEELANSLAGRDAAA